MLRGTLRRSFSIAEKALQVQKCALQNPVGRAEKDPAGSE